MNGSRRRIALAVSLWISMLGCVQTPRTAEPASALKLTLVASAGDFVPGTTTFGLYFETLGGDIHPVGAAEIRANGRRLDLSGQRQLARPQQDLKARGLVAPYPTGGYWRANYWHLAPEDLCQWLGGTGTFVIEAQLGPVLSNPVLVQIPGDGTVVILDSPQHLRHP